MNKFWRSIEDFPSYECIKELAKNYYKEILKIVVATDYKSMYIVEINSNEKKIKFGMLLFNEISDNIEFELSEENSSLIIDKLNEFEYKKYEDEMFEPGKMTKWCLLSELFNYIEKSLD